MLVGKRRQSIMSSCFVLLILLLLLLLWLLLLLLLLLLVPNLWVSYLFYYFFLFSCIFLFLFVCFFDNPHCTSPLFNKDSNKLGECAFPQKNTLLTANFQLIISIFIESLTALRSARTFSAWQFCQLINWQKWSKQFALLVLLWFSVIRLHENLLKPFYHWYIFALTLHWAP